MKRSISTVAMSVLIGCLVAGTACTSTPTRESTGAAVDSAVITTKVKAALAAEDITSLLQIEVETFRDVVQLSGFVDNEEQRDMAGTIAADVAGVENVRNDLIVKPEASS